MTAIQVGDIISVWSASVHCWGETAVRVLLNVLYSICTTPVLQLHHQYSADKDFWEFEHTSCVCNYLSMWWWFDVLYKPSYESTRRKWQQNVKVDFNAIMYGKHCILEWLLMTIRYNKKRVLNPPFSPSPLPLPPPFQCRKELLFYNLTEDWLTCFLFGTEQKPTPIIQVFFNLSVIVGVYNADIKKMRLHMNIATAVTMWKLIRGDTAVRNMEVTVYNLSKISISII